MQGGGLSELMQGAAPPDTDDSGPKDPLSSLQDVIEEFPPLLHALQDPADVDMAVQALKLLTAVQKRIMTSQGTPGQQ